MMIPVFEPWEAVLLLGCMVATYTDFTTQKIPNQLTGLLLLTGFLGQALFGSLQDAVLGFVVGFVLHFGLWAAGVARGGDAKLMMAVSVYVGWAEMMEITAWQYVLMAPIGVGILIARGRLKNFVYAVLWTLQKASGHDAGPRPEGTKLIFGPLIFLSILVARATTWFEVFAAPPV